MEEGWLLALLQQALRAGIGVQEFWDLTPVETYMAIEASIWREQQRQKQSIAQAWYSAALQRAKRLPPLKQLLQAGPAKRLVGAELRARRDEYAQAQAALNRLDLSRLPKLPPIQKLEGDEHA